MALPDKLRVKLLSDDAGAISITPVVVQEMAASDLVDLIVSQVGKQPDRIGRILRSGTLVSGASRYRWERCDPDRVELEHLLSSYPDPRPGQPFEHENCTLVVLHFHLGGAIELVPASLRKHRFLKRRSFWNAIVDLTGERPPDYIDYSYREKADLFRLELSRSAVTVIREAAALLTFSGLARRLRDAEPAAIDLYTARSGS